mgnify:CR=1 FL=1
MDIKRRKFILGCSVLSITPFGLSVSGCSKNTTEHETPEAIPDGKEISLSVQDKATLDSVGYLQQESDERILLFYDNQYYAFSQTCPHGEGGKIQASSTDGNNKFRCSKHNNQTFDKEGASNRSETGTNVVLSTVVIV